MVGREEDKEERRDLAVPLKIRYALSVPPVRRTGTGTF